MVQTEKSFSAPVVYGWSLLVVANAAEKLPLLAHKLAKDGRLFSLRDQNISGPHVSLPIPLSYIVAAANKNEQSLNQKNEEQWHQLQVDKKSQSLYLSFWDYHLAYLEKRTTPSIGREIGRQKSTGVDGTIR
ncbi:hypothetical protein BC941DRAFT_123338 [Chlamydoabsidia padenii]|nr:hypothetical protein BC941DRAFT_123338 [Chlamydoabsidia padenii]